MRTDDAIEVINNAEGQVYFHESDADSAVGVVVVAPDTVEGFPYQTIVWGDDMPELFAEAYLNAPRFMDDYGNERVVGFVTLRDLVRSYGDMEGASRAFRYMTNFRTHYFYHATFQALR
jgi:CBS domain-containing protein